VFNVLPNPNKRVNASCVNGYCDHYVGPTQLMNYVEKKTSTSISKFLNQKKSIFKKGTRNFLIHNSHVLKKFPNILNSLGYVGKAFSKTLWIISLSMESLKGTFSKFSSLSMNDVV